MAKETEEQIDARMKAAEKQLAQDVQDKFNKEGDVDARDSRLEAAGRLRRTEPASKAPAKKVPVVTKEQLAKSGFTNLRDYMNKQKGLTRRDGSAAEKTPEKASAPSAKGAMIQSMDTDMMRTAGRTAAKEAGASRKASAESEAKAKDKKTFGALNRTETNRAQRESAMRDDKASYKKGGSINGIAKRGLTNCKMR